MDYIMVTGSASGLGKAIYEKMINELPTTIEPFGLDRNAGQTVDHVLDVRNEYPCKHIAHMVADAGRRVLGLINCAGVNKIGPMEEMNDTDWHEVVGTNAGAIWQMSKAFLPALEETRGFILNVVSNASRMPMTHSILYNASKAAAAMMTKQMARELTKSKGITVFGVNPNKLEGTQMSRYIEHTVCRLRGWTPKEAAKYQLAALPSGKETTCEQVAELIVWLISKRSRHEYLTGCLLDLGGPAP